MSTQPRRSLRLRSSSLSVNPIEHDKIEEASVTPQKLSPPSIPKSVTKNAKTRRNLVVDKDDPDVMDNVSTIEEKSSIGKSKVRTIQSRKREVSRVEKEEESDEEEEAMEEGVPAKTRRTDVIVDKSVGESKNADTEMKAVTVIESKGRPRRECVRRTTVEQYDDLMSGSASSSDVTSSESEVDDSDLEKEIQKAKGRRARKSVKGAKKEESTESSSDSVSEEEDDDEEEEEEEESSDEELAKRYQSRPSSSRSGRCSRNGGKRRQISKRERNELPLQLLHDREYDVDYDEMVEWEAKSVKMVRDLRELERERANGGQIMDNVNEFIQSCLKDGRMTEMDEKESVRVTHLHEDELMEMNRKKKLSVAERMKETVLKEKQRLEEEREEESDDEEDEWEEMDLVDGKEENYKGGVEVMIETKKKLNAPWKAKWIRQEVNREVRQRCENIHKVHLVSYIAHLRHLMALAKSDARMDGGIPLSAISLSFLPSNLLDVTKSTVGGEKPKNEIVMGELMKWWRKKFTMKKNEMMDGLNECERMEELMKNGHFENIRDAVVLFSSFASHLNLPLRIVARCLVVTKKPNEDTSASKKEKKSRGKKYVNDEEQTSVNEQSITYWCELWNDEEKTWKVCDPFIESFEDEEKKENKRGKNNKDNSNKKREAKGIVSDFVKSWNFSSHLEPFHSCMEKDGPVLYFIAVDYQWCLRDVSSRYINGKDLISRELKGRRANEGWLEELWENKRWTVDGNSAKQEDAEWMEKMKKMEMPKTVAAFKDHPLFVLDKDVLKMQIIFPYDTQPIGEIHKYKIFLRKFVRPINTPKWYEKMGRQIKKEEPPCGEKQVTNPMSGETGTQGLYGYWQTEPWDGGEVVEGRIPRNEFGNVYMYQPEMVPRGCIYLVPEGLQRVASELGKDFVPAVIAWYYKGGSTIPLIRGAVFVKEDLPELLAAWKVSYKRWKEEERKVRTDRCMRRWKKLIKGMLRLASMKKEFEPIDRKKKGKSLDEEAVEEEEKASWPATRYGGEMFEQM